MSSRRRRSDRNFILYQIKNTKTNQIYIGISAVLGRALQKTVRRRFAKHVSKAMCAGKDWTLHRAMRKHSLEVWETSILEVVRGKKAAFRLERETIRRLGPALNSF
jgi:hypothetical protein